MDHAADHIGWLGDATSDHLGLPEPDEIATLLARVEAKAPTGAIVVVALSSKS